MDDGLKQRLVGAVVLVAIAVLFLPSLFDRDSRRTVDLNSQIPPGPPVVTELLEVADPEQPDGVPAAKPLAENYPHEAAAVAESSSSEEGQTTTDSSVAAAESETPAGMKPTAQAGTSTTPEDGSAAPELNAEGVADGWSVQVASFQSSERAESMRQRLQSEGYKSYIREATSSGSTVHRVFVGPKLNKAAAQAEKRSIDEQFDTRALIVEFKP